MIISLRSTTKPSSRTQEVARAVKPAIQAVFADIEFRLAELGRYHISRKEDLPDSIALDLYEVLRQQGVFDFPSEFDQAIELQEIRWN
jgi:hypothetical protein